MAENVDKDKAKEVLGLANGLQLGVDDAIGVEIREILNGTHKTYKYILVNALLAKSVNQKIDALCLQAGAEPKGAYDARSLCHEVLVPFERKFYPGSLGGSNEPFLNKPARAKKLAHDNPVRPGNDKKTLDKLIGLLCQIKKKSDAMRYLSVAISEMREIHKRLGASYHVDDLVVGDKGNVQVVLDFVNLLVGRNLGGEVCALVVATVESFYWGNDCKVRPHKVNESGASSKEIGDIDVYDSCGKIITSIEVKDKVFTKEDVDHAIRKFVAANVGRSMFVYGKSAEFERSEVYQVAARYGRKGYFCSVVYVMDYVKLRLTHMMNNETLSDFVNQMLFFAQQINASSGTVDWIKETAQMVSFSNESSTIKFPDYDIDS